MGVVVETEDKFLRAGGYQDVQGEPTIPTRADYGYPDLIFKPCFLQLYLWLRCRASGLGFSNLSLLPEDAILPLTRGILTLLR